MSIEFSSRCSVRLTQFLSVLLAWCINNTLPTAVEATATTHGPGFAVVTAERTAAQTVTLRGRLLGPTACQSTPTLTVDSIVQAGRSYTMFVTKGSGMSDNTFSQVAFSLFPVPSIAPGIVSLSIGNSFTNLFFWPQVVSYEPGGCTASWLLPSFVNMQGATLHFQGWAADFDLPSIFPLVVTNPVTITYN